MIIENPNAFKAWLAVVLKPICEADPAALSKYVFALVKKDKSPEILRPSMINELEVFLQNETEDFVNLLFTTLESKEYLTPVIPNANPPNPNVNTNSKIDTSPQRVKDTVVKKEIIPVSELLNLSEPVNGTVAVKKESEVKRDKEIRKSDSEKEEKVRRRSGHRSTSRNRSRSRSWERNRRSRDKDRDTFRDKRPRPYRNKSPPRRYDRIRSRSRSPRPQYRGRYRNRSPPRSGSRSRSRSIDKKDRKDLKNHTVLDVGVTDSNHIDKDLRPTNASQNIQSVVPQAKSGSHSPKKRCRDYDEQGFCMRGEMCPYDHGVDPVVLEDCTLSTALMEPNTMIPPPIIPPPVHPIIHPHMPPRPVMPEYNPQSSGKHHSASNEEGDVFVQAPLMWNRGGFRGPRAMLGPRIPQLVPFMPPSNLQRELISVPVMDNQQPHQFNNNFSRQQYVPPKIEQHDALFKKKAFDYNRLGPRTKNPSNCSLELKKVPTGLNNITHLNNHFAKFGKIVNIQVVYEGDLEAALVTFSSHAEANAAYRSTEAVLNNRFIKVFWHSNGNDGKQENVPPRPVKERLGTPNTVPPNSNKVLNLVQPKADNAEEESTEKVQTSFTKNNLVVNKEENKAQAAAAILKGQELLAAKEKIKKTQEEKRKEALKLTQNLRKRKQELLEKQLAQQKILIEKLEKTSAGSQRDLLMQTIKKSQEATEAIRNDMLSQSSPVSTPTSNIKTKEDVQKEVLDTELDLITKQQEGVDTSDLQKKLLELKARIKISDRRALRGRRFNPISRHLLTKNNLVDGIKKNAKLSHDPKKISQKLAIDHRPTKLLVSGYEVDEQESLLAYFATFGEIVDYVSDPAIPSLVLNYKTRKEAEVAILKGKNFEDRTLSITWCNSAQPSNPLSGRTSTRTVLVSESDDDYLLNHNVPDIEGPAELEPIVSEEGLLQDDEEDDEDNEGRSWRR